MIFFEGSERLLKFIEQINISSFMVCVTIKSNLPKDNLNASCGPHKERRFTINYLV